MKQTITIDAGLDADHLVFDFHGELEPFEAKALNPVGGKLLVVLDPIPLGLGLFDENKNQFPSENIAHTLTFVAGDRLSLSRTFKFRHFAATDLRKAYVLCRRIAHHVEDTMVLTLPHAPFYGMTQNFNFKTHVPSEVLGFEAFRRSILVRG